MQRKPIAGAVAMAVGALAREQGLHRPVEKASEALELAAAHGRAERAGSVELAVVGGRDDSLVFDDGKEHPAPPKRRLTVDLRIEAEAIGDTPLAHLVVGALQEFIAANPTTMEGKFESTAGLDVSWTVRNEYFDVAGRRVDCDGNPEA